MVPAIVHPFADYIEDVEPLVNKFVSVPKDYGSLNCAAFIAGVIHGVLLASGFVRGQGRRVGTLSAPLLHCCSLLSLCACPRSWRGILNWLLAWMRLHSGLLTVANIRRLVLVAFVSHVSHVFFFFLCHGPQRPLDGVLFNIADAGRRRATWVVPAARRRRHFLQG